MSLLALLTCRSTHNPAHKHVTQIYLIAYLALMKPEICFFNSVKMNNLLEERIWCSTETIT